MLIEKNKEEKGTNTTENIVLNTKNEVTENVIENNSENTIDKTNQKENDEKEKHEKSRRKAAFSLFIALQLFQCFCYGLGHGDPCQT